MNKENTYPRFTAKEWNAGGSFHFYGTRKPRCFMVEVTTTEDIRGDLLQQAVEMTLQRLPYYADTFVRKKGLYYYADNDLPFLVAESEKGRVIGGAGTNYHMMDVTYWKGMIRFAMFHGLCDGQGLNRFVEATLYHYFCLKDGKEYSDEGIWTDKVPYDPAERLDPIAEESKVDIKDLKKLANSEKRFRLPELADYKGPTLTSLSLRFPSKDFIAWCKGSSASPAVAVAAILTKAVARECEVPEGVIMSVLPISLRRYLHAEKTFKNCSAAAFLPTTPADARDLSTAELAARLRVKIKEQMSDEMGLLLSSSINFITHLGKKLPFFFLKNKVMAMGENRPQDTFFVDYVGSLRTQGFTDQIVGVRYLNPDPSFGCLFVNMNEIAGYFYLNIAQTFENDRYFQACADILEEMGIPCEKLPRDTYLTPEVELPPEQRW